MITADDFEIFLTVPPGLEPVLCAELAETGFRDPKPGPGGVSIQGGWPDVWRANLDVRGAARVLARIDSFRVVHLSQLDKRSRRVDWASVLRSDVPVKVDASCRKSKIYHAGAATERVARAIHESIGAPLAEGDEDAVTIKVRIEDNLCTISVDTSGELLHRRGFKEAVAKAPMRENLAALFLRQCGYDGHEPVLDPMCGSGTFVIEAAEMAAGLAPGRARSFAFEKLATFDAGAWQAMRPDTPELPSDPLGYGSDRNTGAIEASEANAARAGVETLTRFQVCDVADLRPPEGPPGLVIVNPPYGARIGNKKALYALYGTLGATLRTHFTGWRVGLVTTDAALARGTRLPFAAPGRPVDHGGLKIRLFQTQALR